MKHSRVRARRRAKVLHRNGRYAPPRRHLPARQREYQSVARVKANGFIRGRFIYSPWPHKMWRYG